MNCTRRCFPIKIKVKGYLENKTKNTKELIEQRGIKKEHQINYSADDIKHQIILKKEEIIFVREGKEFTCEMVFANNKKTKATYFIKEYNTNLEFDIQTNDVIITEKKIKLDYTVTDSNENYIYQIEMSEIK